MEVSCQRNGHLAVTNHVSGRGFVQATPWQLISHGEGVPEVAMHKLGNQLIFNACIEYLDSSCFGEGGNNSNIYVFILVMAEFLEYSDVFQEVRGAMVC